MLFNKNNHSQNQNQNQNQSQSNSKADKNNSTPSVRPNVRIMPGAKKSAGGTFFGMFVGLVIGIVVAAAVVMLINQAPTPFNPEEAQKKHQENADANKLVQQAKKGDLVELPNKPGDKIPEKRFQFYDILPNGQTAPNVDKNAVQMDGLAALPNRADDFIEPTELDDDGNGDENAEKNNQNLVEKTPEVVENKATSEKQEKSEITKKTASESLVSGKVFIKAGSFSRSQEADNQKAKLAMLGIEAYIQQVMVQDKTFYRVRLGPFNEKEANNVQRELSAANIQSTMIK